MLKNQGTSPQEKKDLTDEQELLKNILGAIDKLDAPTIRKFVLEAKVETIPLLSSKNFLIIANISEDDLANPTSNPHVAKLIATFGADRIIPVCVKIESELSSLSGQEKAEMMDMFGITKPTLDTIIEKSYQNLGLITFFTCGPQEIHAWPILKNTTIRSAAGEIHSDLERGFICAEIFNVKDLASTPLSKLKEVGKIRTEGKDYIVQDGDIVHVKFNV